MRQVASRSPGWLRAVLYAMTLHAVVIAALVVGFRIVDRDNQAHAPMQATVVRELPPEAASQQQLKREEERKQRDAETQRTLEEQRRKETERVRLEIERKQQDEAAKKQQQQAAEKKKQAAEAEKKKRETENKQQVHERQQQAEQAMREQMAEEEKSRAAARASRLSPDADKYRTAIRQKVSRNWTRPPSARKGLQCVVRVRQAPGGEVLEAKVVQSSGDTIFDRSVENAVFKASPLPLPENQDVFDRDIEFTFRSEE